MAVFFFFFFFWQSRKEGGWLVGARGGNKKHGQYVLVRKLTSQSTDPVALFGVNVHSRGVDVLDAGVLLRCRDVK